MKVKIFSHLALFSFKFLKTVFFPKSSQRGLFVNIFFHLSKQTLNLVDIRDWCELQVVSNVAKILFKTEYLDY